MVHFQSGTYFTSLKLVGWVALSEWKLSWRDKRVFFRIKASRSQNVRPLSESSAQARMEPDVFSLRNWSVVLWGGKLQKSLVLLTVGWPKYNATEVILPLVERGDVGELWDTSAEHFAPLLQQHVDHSRAHNKTEVSCSDLQQVAADFDMLEHPANLMDLCIGEAPLRP